HVVLLHRTPRVPSSSARRRSPARPSFQFLWQIDLFPSITRCSPSIIPSPPRRPSFLLRWFPSPSLLPSPLPLPAPVPLLGHSYPPPVLLPSRAVRRPATGG